MQQIAEESRLDSWPGAMQEKVEDQMNTVEVYKMVNGMSKYEGVKQLNLKGANVKTPEICPWKRDAKQKQNHCMNNRGRSTFCIINSNKACMSTELASLIYNMVEKIQAVLMKTIKQELCKPDKSNNK